jgi:uridine kinase
VNNLSLDDLINSILSAKPKFPNVRMIAIDGPAGAGKSTLAKRIKSNLQEQSGLKTAIVHMDDLYDGWENALTDQLTKTLINQILVPVSLAKNFSYRKYNWLSGSFGDFSEEDSPEILILEGVGSGQKATRRYLDQLIWIDIDAETGLQRVLQRDGDYLENEMRVWQMRESSHFSKENTRDSATIRINGSFFI